MKIGFTSRVCPEWDLTTIATKAAELAYDGVEIGGFDGESNRSAHVTKSLGPAVDELISDPDAAKRLFADRGVELVCLSTGETLEAFSTREASESRDRVLRVIELAGRLGCPYVRVPIGNLPQGDNRDRTLARLAFAFESLADSAAKQRVTVLVENGGSFSGSEDVWFVLDHVSHPAVAACWNSCAAMVRLERPTISVPRLGRWIKLARVCDGAFDACGQFDGFRVPGEGDVQLDRMIDFLRGIIFTGYLMFDWPKATVTDLSDADIVLPKVQAQLRTWIDTKAAVLTAYKGDKKPVHLDLPVVEAPPAEAAQTAK